MPAIFSTEFLTDAEARSLAPARAQIARSLAGRLRWVHELATGAFTVGGDGAKSGLNPSGSVGADRSGYPWGSCLQHPLWSADGVRQTAGVVGDRPFLTLSTTPVTFELRVRVKPFLMRALTPYSRGYFRATIAAASASSTTTTVTLTSMAGVARSANMTIATTTPTTSLPTLWVDLVPGLNRIRLQFSPPTGVNLLVIGCSLNQIVERTH